MKRAFIILLLLIFSSISAFSLHEVELKSGNYFYGIMESVFGSHILFRSIDLQKQYDIDKIDIVNMKEINAEVHLLNGEEYICTVNFEGKEYVLKNSFLDKTVPANEITFIRYNDRNDKVIEKKNEQINDIIDPEAKYFYNRMGAGIGWPAALNLYFSRTMKQHEVGFVLGLTGKHDMFLTFEFDYAYLFENTGPVSHGVFAGIGYNFEDRNFTIEDHSYLGYSYERVTNDYFYLGAGYKLNLYFINMKLGYAIPLSQSYDTNIDQLHFDVKHLLLFQFGLNFRF